jgi:hypothetical protein
MSTRRYRWFEWWLGCSLLAVTGAALAEPSQHDDDSKAHGACADLRQMSRLARAGSLASEKRALIDGLRGVHCADAGADDGSTLSYSDHSYARIGTTWYYPNGVYARIGTTWYYPNRKYACIGSTWYYPNGDYARIGSTWYRPDGGSTSEKDLLAWICEAGERLCDATVHAYQQASDEMKPAVMVDGAMRRTRWHARKHHAHKDEQ